MDDELHVDHYNEKDQQLFQVMVNQHNDNGIKTGSFTPGLLANALEKEIPEIEYAVTVLPASWFPDKGLISSGDAHIKARGQFIGKEYFNVFSCRFIDGDKRRLFADKYSIAISNELAMKLFNTTKKIVGKTVKWDHEQFGGSYLISGIFEKDPSNATNQFDRFTQF